MQSPVVVAVSLETLGQYSPLSGPLQAALRSVLALYASVRYGPPSNEYPVSATHQFQLCSMLEGLLKTMGSSYGDLQQGPTIMAAFIQILDAQLGEDVSHAFRSQTLSPHPTIQITDRHISICWPLVTVCYGHLVYPKEARNVVQ